MGKQYVSMGFGGILIYFHANGSTTIPPDIKINVVNLRIDHQFTNRGVPISAVVYNIYLINMILYIYCIIYTYTLYIYTLYIVHIYIYISHFASNALKYQQS